MKRPTFPQLLRIQYELWGVGINMDAFCFVGDGPWFEFVWDCEAM